MPATLLCMPTERNAERKCNLKQLLSRKERREVLLFVALPAQLEQMELCNIFGDLRAIYFIDKFYGFNLLFVFY